MQTFHRGILYYASQVQRGENLITEALQCLMLKIGELIAERNEKTRFALKGKETDSNDS